MNREVLNDYKNKDEKMLLAEVLDKIENTNNRNKIEHTDFLDLAQNELVQKFLNKQKVKNYIKYGGFDEAERKMYVFYPEKFNEQVVEKNLVISLSIIISAPLFSTIISPTFSLFTPSFITAPK